MEHNAQHVAPPRSRSSSGVSEARGLRHFTSDESFLLQEVVRGTRFRYTTWAHGMQILLPRQVAGALRRKAASRAAHETALDELITPPNAASHAPRETTAATEPTLLKSPAEDDGGETVVVKGYAESNDLTVSTTATIEEAANANRNFSTGEVNGEAQASTATPATATTSMAAPAITATGGVPAWRPSSAQDAANGEENTGHERQQARQATGEAKAPRLTPWARRSDKSDDGEELEDKGGGGDGDGEGAAEHEAEAAGMTREAVAYDAHAMAEWLRQYRHELSHVPPGIARFSEVQNAAAAARRSTSHTLSTIDEVWSDRQRTPISVSGPLRQYGLFGKAEKKTLQQMVNAVLNKVTANSEHFKEVKNEMLRLPIPEANPEQLEGIVRLFFAKSVQEKAFCSNYADLLAHLCLVPENQQSAAIAARPTQTFEYHMRTTLIHLCEHEFDLDTAEDIEHQNDPYNSTGGVAAAVEGESVAGVATLTAAEPRRRLRTVHDRREAMKGTARFLCELFLRDIVDATAVARMIQVCCTGGVDGHFIMPPHYTPTESQIDQIIIIVDKAGERFFVQTECGAQLLPSLRHNLHYWEVNHNVTRVCLLLTSTVARLDAMLQRVAQATVAQSGPSPPVPGALYRLGFAHQGTSSGVTSTTDALRPHLPAASGGVAVAAGAMNGDKGGGTGSGSSPPPPPQHAVVQPPLRIHVDPNVTWPVAPREETGDGYDDAAAGLPRTADLVGSPEEASVAVGATPAAASDGGRGRQEGGVRWPQPQSPLSGGAIPQPRSRRLETGGGVRQSYGGGSGVTSAEASPLIPPRAAGLSIQVGYPHFSFPGGAGSQAGLRPGGGAAAPFPISTSSSVAALHITPSTPSPERPLLMSTASSTGTANTNPVAAAATAAEGARHAGYAHEPVTAERVTAWMTALRTQQRSIADLAAELLSASGGEASRAGAVLAAVTLWVRRGLCVVKEKEARLHTGPLLAALVASPAQAATAECAVYDTSNNSNSNEGNESGGGRGPAAPPLPTRDELRDVLISALEEAVHTEEFKDIKLFEFWAQIILSDVDRVVLDEELLNDGLEMVADLIVNPEEQLATVQQYLVEVGQYYMERRVQGTLRAPTAESGFTRYRPLLRLHLRNTELYKDVELGFVASPTVQCCSLEARVFCALCSSTSQSLADVVEELFHTLCELEVRLQHDATLAAELMSAILVAELCTGRCYLDRCFALLQSAVDGPNRAEREMTLAVEVLQVIAATPRPMNRVEKASVRLLKLSCNEVICDETRRAAEQWWAGQHAEMPMTCPDMAPAVPPDAGLDAHRRPAASTVAPQPPPPRVGSPERGGGSARSHPVMIGSPAGGTFRDAVAGELRGKGGGRVGRRPRGGPTATSTDFAAHTVNSTDSNGNDAGAGMAAAEGDMVVTASAAHTSADGDRTTTNASPMPPSSMSMSSVHASEQNYTSNPTAAPSGAANYGPAHRTTTHYSVNRMGNRRQPTPHSLSHHHNPRRGINGRGGNGNGTSSQVGSPAPGNGNSLLDRLSAVDAGTGGEATGPAFGPNRGGTFYRNRGTNAHRGRYNHHNNNSHTTGGRGQNVANGRSPFSANLSEGGNGSSGGGGNGMGAAYYSSRYRR